MEKQKIEDLIEIDLDTFLKQKAKNGSIALDDALEIAAYVSANFMRVIYTKNKNIEKHEINGIFGIVSDFYNNYFEGQITKDEYYEMSQKAIKLLQNNDFDEMSKAFFNDLFASEKKQ